MITTCIVYDYSSSLTHTNEHVFVAVNHIESQSRICHYILQEINQLPVYNLPSTF